jgi:hypothetical protein
MQFAQLIVIIGTLAVLVSASSAEPTIVLLEGTPDWRSVFSQSEVVTLNDDAGQLPGVTVHYRTNTIYELPLKQPLGDVSAFEAPKNLWDAIHAWVGIGLAKFFEKPISDANWTSVTTPGYHGQVGKPNAEGDILEWPMIQELPASPETGVITRLYVGGVLEYNGFLMPLCIYAAHPPGTTPSTKYLLDDFVSNDSEFFCVKPFVQQIGDAFRICEVGGPYGTDFTDLARKVLTLVHCEGPHMAGIWFEPNLDRLLPKLLSYPVPP